MVGKRNKPHFCSRRFEVPLVAALSHYRRSRQLIDMIRFEESVMDGAKAVELAPDDPNAHMFLGLLSFAQDDETKRAANLKQTASARRR